MVFHLPEGLPTQVGLFTITPSGERKGKKPEDEEFGENSTVKLIPFTRRLGRQKVWGGRKKGEKLNETCPERLYEKGNKAREKRDNRGEEEVRGKPFPQYKRNLLSFSIGINSKIGR